MKIVSGIEGVFVSGNRVNLCDSCMREFPWCDGEMIFGDGKGNDNVCCCDKYEPISKKVRDRTTAKEMAEMLNGAVGNCLRIFR